jgi:hypothetical protein
MDNAGGHSDMLLFRHLPSVAKASSSPSSAVADGMLCERAIA